MPPKKPARKPSVSPSLPPPPIQLAVVADVHIGNHGRFGGPLVDGLNRRGHQTLDAFRAAVVEARNRGALCFIVAGDLFHQANPGPKLLHAVQTILEDAGNMGVLLIPGNHDMLDATAVGGNTALAPLARWATIPTCPTWYRIGSGDTQVAVLAVPFQAQQRMDQYLVGLLGEAGAIVGWDPSMESMLKVLVTHVGVFSAEYGASWMVQSKDAITAEDLTASMAEADIGQAFVGNYHSPQEWSCLPMGHVIHQCGTLVPHRFEQGDMGLDRGSMCLYGVGQRVQRVSIPGPRFLDVPDADRWSPPTGHPGCLWYIRQKGGTPPLGTADSRGWEALVHKPDADATADGPEALAAAPSTVLSPEEAIRQVATSHPLSGEGWITADELAGTSIATYKDALK